VFSASLHTLCQLIFVSHPYKVPACWNNHVARVYYIGLQSSVQANNQFEYKLDAAMNRPIATTAAARSSNSVPRSCMYLRLYMIMEGRGLGRYGRASVRSNGGCVESKSKKIRVELSASSKETNAQKNGTISIPHVLCAAAPLASLAHRFHILPEETTTEFRAGMPQAPAKR